MEAKFVKKIFVSELYIDNLYTHTKQTQSKHITFPIFISFSAGNFRSYNRTQNHLLFEFSTAFPFIYIHNSHI